MTDKKPAKKSPRKASPRTSTTFSDDEKAAMRERAKEAKGEARRRAGGDSAGDVAAVLEKLAAMAPADRALGERLHALITSTAPTLAPKLWYGMPAYARDGTVVCFFQDARKFKTRYCTLGFSDKAMLDDGQMWATSFALTKLTAADEATIVALVKKAVG